MSDSVVLNPAFSSEGWNTIVIDVDGAELADVSCAIAPAFVSALHDCDAIRVYGYYLPENATPAVTCLVDGAAVAVSDPPSSLAAGNSNYARWLICQVNNLSHYTHTVELTVTNIFNPNSFCFDHVEAHPVALAAQPESTQNNSTTTADSPPPQKDSKDDSDTDAYVGITVVATALGGTIWLCWRWWRRWHERKRARVSSAPLAQDNGTENIEEGQPTHTSKTVQTGIFFFSWQCGRRKFRPKQASPDPSAVQGHAAHNPEVDAFLAENASAVRMAEVSTSVATIPVTISTTTPAATPAATPPSTPAGVLALPLTSHVSVSPMSTLRIPSDRVRRRSGMTVEAITPGPSCDTIRNMSNGDSFPADDQSALRRQVSNKSLTPTLRGVQFTADFIPPVPTISEDEEERRTKDIGLWISLRQQNTRSSESLQVEPSRQNSLSKTIVAP